MEFYRDPFTIFFSLFLYLTSNDLDIRSVHLIFFVGRLFPKVSNFSASTICLYEDVRDTALSWILTFDIFNLSLVIFIR